VFGIDDGYEGLEPLNLSLNSWAVLKFQISSNLSFIPGMKGANSGSTSESDAFFASLIAMTFQQTGDNYSIVVAYYKRYGLIGISSDAIANHKKKRTS
jgi:hypothetical protein